MSRKLSTETIYTQGGWQPKSGEPRQLPIYQSATFKYETNEQIGRLLDLEENGYFYIRLANPTNDAVASKIYELEGDVGATLTSSGQAANLFAITSLCSAGDHVVNSVTLYGETSNLFTVALKRFGVDFTLVDPNAPGEELERAFQPDTKAAFGETIASPALMVLDIERLVKLAHKHKVPLILDNTFAAPINCHPFEWRTDIVTHFTTKYMDGHALTMGDYIVDSGNFDWETHKEEFPRLTTPDDSCRGVIYTQRFGKIAYTMKATTQLVRDLGSIQAPESALLLNIDLEILHLRVPRHCENALKVTQYLQPRDDMAWVSYPGLEGDKYYELTEKCMSDGTCGVISSCLKGGRKGAVVSIDKLKLVSVVTHVADVKTCVLHPASHTHRQLDDAQLKEAGVDLAMIRLNAGIENVDDIIADLEQALN